MDHDERVNFLSVAEAIAKGRRDPVFFGEHFLGLKFHDLQKIWLWLTTRTQIRRAYDLALSLEVEMHELEVLLLHPFLKNILCPSNRFGKEQPISEPILTEKGFRPIGSVKTGDQIYTMDGILTKVIAVYPQGKKDVYRLTFNDGSWTRAGIDHLWKVITPNNRFTKIYNNKGKRGKDKYPNKNYKKFSVLTTKQIIHHWGMTPKPYNKVEIPTVKPIKFPEKKLSIDPYILGLLLGDGGMTTNSITFSTDDQEMIEAIGNYRKRANSKYDYQLHGIVGALRKLNLLGTTSDTKFIPDEYLWNSVENRIAILQGLLDTDGCFNKNGIIEYVTVSPKLAKAVKFLVQSLGGQVVTTEKYPTYIYKGKKKQGKRAYRLTIKIKLNPFRLKRKKILFDNYKYHTTKNKILVSIKKENPEESVCIQVAHPSHLYITRDFIVTHNTFVTSVKHVWYNFYKIGLTGPPHFIADMRYGTLNISPHSLQVDAAYKYIVDIFQDKFIYKWEGEVIRNKCRIKNHLIDHKQTRREIIFAKYATLKGVPTGEDQASSLAGTQFSYISYDEAPQSLHLRKELPAKIQSRLIDTGGPMDIIGTPEVDKPSHAYYHRIVKKGIKIEDGFFTLLGKLDDNPFIGDEEKSKTLESIKQTDPEKYRQVAFGEFISSGAKLLPIIAIERLWEGETPLEMGEPNHKYIIGVDWGFADTGDPTVFYVIDYTKLRELLDKKAKISGILYKVVFRESIKGGEPGGVLAKLKILQEDFNNAIIIHDSSSMGGTILKKMLRTMKVGNLIDFSFSGKKGGKTGSKEEMLFLMVMALTNNRKIEKDSEGRVNEVNPNFGSVRSFYIPELEEQLSNYKVDDKKLEQDDVMAFSLAIWYCEKKLAGHTTKVFDINILADKPEDILSVPDAKTRIKETNIKIQERVIG